MESTSNTSLFQFGIDANSAYALRGASGWAKVMAVVGLILGIACLAVAGAVIAEPESFNNGLNRGYESYGNNQNIIANTFGTAYIITGLIFLISSVFALSFANRIKKALRTSDQFLLGSAFSSVRNYFAFWAILMILMLLLVVIFIAALMSNGGYR